MYKTTNWGLKEFKIVTLNESRRKLMVHTTFHTADTGYKTKRQMRSMTWYRALSRVSR